MYFFVSENSLLKFFTLLLKYSVKWISIHYAASNSIKMNLISIKIKSLSCHVQIIKLCWTLKKQKGKKIQVRFSTKVQRAQRNEVGFVVWKLTIYPEKNKQVDEHQNRYWYEHRHRYILNFSRSLRNIFPFDGANLTLLCIFLFHLIFRRCLGAFHRATNSSSSWPRTRAMGKSQPLVGDQCMQIWAEGMGDNNNGKSKTKISTILNWSTLFLSRCIGQLMKEQQGPESLWRPDWTESGLINSNANWMGPKTCL